VLCSMLPNLMMVHLLVLSNVVFLCGVQYEATPGPVKESNKRWEGPAFKSGHASSTSGFSKWPEHIACPIPALKRQSVHFLAQPLAALSSLYAACYI
jgi:hypothetical protein